MSSSGLFSGDPGLLLLGEEADEDANSEDTSGGGSLRPDPRDAPQPRAIDAHELSSAEVLLAAASAQEEDSGQLDMASAVRVAAQDAPEPAGLIDRVRKGALLGREHQHEEDLDALVFDAGYDPRLDRGRVVPPAGSATADDAPAIITADRVPARAAPRGDQFEGPTGDVLSAASTVFDVGYSDDAAAPSDPGRPAFEEDTSAPVERPSGPLRVFVGLPSTHDTGSHEQIRPASGGPVWDAWSLSPPSEEATEGDDWGDDGMLLGALPAEPEDSEEVLEAGPAGPATRERVEALEAYSAEMTDEQDLEAVLASARVRSSAPAGGRPADVLLDAPLNDAADAPLFPTSDAADRDSRPWWVAPEEGEEVEAEGAMGPAPLARPEEAPLPAPPEIELGPSRLADDLARPLPDDEPTGSARRQAPWEDPDPWTTGAFRPIRAEDLPPTSAPMRLEALAPRRSATARPGTSVPELAPMDHDRGGGGRGTQVALFAVLVVAVIASAVQLLGRPDVADLLMGQPPEATAPTAADVAQAPTTPPTEADAGGEPLPAATPSGDAVAAAADAVLAVAPEAPVAPTEEAVASKLPPLAPTDGLDADAETGMLHVIAPKGARVRVDGELVGRAPIERQRIEVGEHRVQVGSRTWRIHVSPGRMATVDAGR